MNIAYEYLFTRPDKQDNNMRLQPLDVLSSESESHNISVRRQELKSQHWNRAKSILLAENEGITLNDNHWAVIKYLRKYYLYEGMPRYALTLSKKLKKQFATQGGSKYLYNLFTGGPVTQGSRLASLHTPSGATDTSFGTRF